MAILRSVLMIAVSILAVDGSVKMLATDNACFSATQFLTAYDFHAPADGEVVGVELEYVSGGITCNFARSLTKWGCNGHYNDWLMVNFLEYGDDGSDSAIFPSSTMEGMTSFAKYGSCSNGHGCSGTFKMSAYTYDSATLVMKDEENPFTVTTADTFSLQMSEGCCGTSTGDNVGVSCAKVYFLYSTVCTNTPNIAAIQQVLDRLEEANGAHSAIGNVDVPSAADLVDDGSWTAMSLSGKDVVIVGMLAVNAVLITSMAVVCCRKQRKLAKYQAVSIASD